MDESRAADAQAINQATANCIPVRSISLAIVVAVVLYVGMATLANWEAFFLTSLFLILSFFNSKEL